MNMKTEEKIQKNIVPSNGLKRFCTTGRRKKYSTGTEWNSQYLGPVKRKND